MDGRDPMAIDRPRPDDGVVHASGVAPARRPDRPVRLVVAVGWVLFTASLLAICGLVVRQSWYEARDRGLASAAFVALSANKSIHGVLETARVALDSVAELALARRLGLTDAEAFDARLDRVQSDVRNVQGIVVQDPAGVVVAAASPRLGLGLSLGDLDYFRILAADPRLRYAIGAPFRSEIFNAVMIPLARSIRNLDGTLLAVVAVGVRVAAIEEALSPGADDPSTVVALWRDDGLLLAAEGRGAPRTGLRHPELPLIATRTTDRDEAYFADVDADGRSRFSGWRNNVQFPYFVSVSLDAARFRSEAVRVTALAATLSAFGLLVMIVLVVVNGRRVREKERSRADLGERERRFRHIVETVPGVVLQWRRDTKGYGLTWVSPRSREVLGIEADDLVREPRHLRVHPDDRDRWFGAIEGITGDEGMWSFTGRFIPPDGAVRDCVIKARTSRDAQGAVVCDGILLDVTEEMRIRAAATETMARLSALFETADDAIVTFDAEGRIIDFNPAAERMFAWPRATILGRDHEVLFPGEAAADGDVDLATHLAEGDAAPIRDWRRFRGRRRSGGTFPLALSLGRFKANGTVYGVAIARDMTDIADVEFRLQEANSELRRLLKAAEDANLAKSRFLSNMSHELRTPLNAVIGFAEMMAEAAFGPHAHPKYAEYARDISDAGRHLLSLVNDILDLSRISDGNLDLVAEPVDTRRAMVRAVRAIWPSVRTGGLRLTVHAGRDLPMLTADPKALHQILLNILSNAVKYTPGGGRITLRLSAARPGMLEIRIEDDGPGIKEDLLPQIGRPFVRGDDTYTSSRAGVGLGLAISMSLSRAMGCELVIESAHGAGTTVILRVPTVPREALARAVA